MPDVVLRKMAARAVYTAPAKKSTEKIDEVAQDRAGVSLQLQPKRLKPPHAQSLLKTRP